MDAKWGAKGWIWRGIGTAMVLALAGFAMHGILSATAGEKAQATPEILAEGKALYEKKCAVCHGTDGRGDGSAAYLLYPKPRDFTSGRFKIHSTMTLPTDQDLFNSITNGIAGTSMPSWASLTEQDRRALVAYVKSLSPVFQAQPGFKGYSLLDTGGEVISISSWDSAASADAASALAAEWVAENMADEIELKEARIGEILFGTALGVSTKAGSAA